ncbi:MAG: LytTR family DNA-binding domain-containing protein [Pseudoxanthomonas sp.]
MSETPSRPAPQTSWDRYLPMRRSFEVGYWLVSFCLSAVVNSVTELMDYQRDGRAIRAWEPMVWEWSSALASLALVPAVLWFTRRYPLHFDTWRRRLPLYLAGSVAWSLLHVLAMVGMRKLAYALQGGNYDFGDWPRELFYEYLKDALTFAGMVVAIHGYRMLLRRLQGEARLLDAPDAGPPVEPVDRPERFLVRKLNREFLIATDDIEWLQASGNYVNLHVAGRDYPLRSTIAAIEARLDPQRFRRVQRSYMVNIEHVASIEPLDSGDARVHLKDGTSVPCSRRYRDALKLG